jgi:hypothetical protein
MDREIKPHVFTATAALSVFVLQAIIGGWLESSGRVTVDDINMAAYKALNLCLAILLGFSIVRPFIRVFVMMQTKMGNEDWALVRFVRSYERGITWVVWGAMSAGLAIAVPKMIEMGLFS